MRVRLHRGGYDESMATTKNVEPNVKALAAFFSADTLHTFVPFNIEVTKYGVGSDPRNGWNTHIVTGEYEGLSQRLVLGYTDSDLPRHKPKIGGRLLASQEITGAIAKTITRDKLGRVINEIPHWVFKLNIVFDKNKHYRLVRINSLRAAQYDTKPVLLISDQSIRTLHVKAFIREHGWDQFLTSSELGEIRPMTEGMLTSVMQLGVKEPMEDTLYVRHQGLDRNMVFLGYLKPRS